ncbi:6-phospho-3-hexuloisomerase [Anaerolineales bacterium]|nr:6-phospho-3-hexuloisomerase [Anaerolineales bacterium]
MNDVVEQVLSELTACIQQLPAESLAQAGRLVESASRVFVAGAGRSGLCMKAFGMRLMHMGKTVHVIGETTTPAITAGDLLVVGSGSGQTSSLLAMARHAQKRGVKILLFTTDAGSSLAEIADHRVVISAPSYQAYPGGHNLTSVQPLGTLFEQSMLILCDSLILGLMQSTGVNAVQMFERHANLE